MGKAIWENPIETWLGENSKLGMFFRTPSKRIILLCVCGWHKNSMERNKILIQCGKYSTKKSIWKNPHLSLIMHTWAALKRPCEIKQRSCGQLQSHVWFANFRGRNWKTSISENFRISSWSYDLKGHAKKCVERYCELSNKTTRMLLEFAESGCPIFRATSPLSQRSTQKQTLWKILDALFSRFGNDWDYFSHNCFRKSAHSLRSSRRNVWRVRNPSRSIGTTRCERAIKLLTRAKCDQDKHTFECMILHMKNIQCKDIENELKSYHNKTDWANFVVMQDFWMLLKLDNTSWRKTLRNSHNFMKLPVVNTLFQEKKKHHNQKVRSEFGPWTETILTPLSEFLMDQTSLWWIWTTIRQKFQKFSSKNMQLKLDARGFCMPIKG